MAFVTVTEAGNALVTVREASGRGLAAGTPQVPQGPGHFPALWVYKAYNSSYSYKGRSLQEKPSLPCEWCEYPTFSPKPE